MGIYTDIKHLNPTSNIPDLEYSGKLYIGEAGAIQAMIESVRNEHLMFEYAINSDANEIAFFNENGYLSDEFLNESISGFLSKVKDYIKKLFEKLKAIIKSFINLLQTIVIRDNKALVKKFEIEVKKKDLSKMKYKWSEVKSSIFNYKIDDEIDFSDKIDKIFGKEILKFVSSHLRESYDEYGEYLLLEKKSKNTTKAGKKAKEFNNYIKDKFTDNSNSSKNSDLDFNTTFSDSPKMNSNNFNIDSLKDKPTQTRVISKEDLDEFKAKLNDSDTKEEIFREFKLDVDNMFDSMRDLFFKDTEEYEGLDSSRLNDIIESLVTSKTIIKGLENSERELDRKYKNSVKQYDDVLKQAKTDYDTSLSSAVIALNNFKYSCESSALNTFIQVIKWKIKECRSVFAKAVRYNPLLVRENTELEEELDLIESNLVEELFEGIYI